MSALLQCQREAARFASRPEHLDEIRVRTRREAIRRICRGEGWESALEVMYAGLKDQLPLTFTPPAVSR